jgi:beta-glucuronidase
MNIKNILLPALLTLMAGSSAYAQQGNLFIGNAMNRANTCLNGKWEYVLDPFRTEAMGNTQIYRNEVPRDKSDRVEYSFNPAQTLWVPGSWNTQKPELMYYESNIWYRRLFDKPDLDDSKRYFVYVGAANYIATVTFNGKRLGRHEGGFTPFCYEVTDLMKKEGNFLIIGVNGGRRADYIPAEVADWFNHGGITRDVLLVETPKAFVSNFYLALDKATLNSKVRKINGRLLLDGETMPTDVRVQIPELKIDQNVTIDADGDVEFTLNAKRLQLWSTENPKLYDVRIIAGNDTVNDLIGFRTIETKGKQILLNGKPIFLKGICLHDENPLRRNRANSIEDAELVIGWAKELGCNFLRLAHYPHQENLVRLADKEGILLWEELPLYWGIQWNNQRVLEKAKKQFEELINRDYNRASSIIWSIANETAVVIDRNKFLSSLADHVRSLDPTRLISAACKKDQERDGHPDAVYTYNDPLMEKLDIISLNEYLGWYGGSPAECQGKTFKMGLEKPVIVSEFGGGALQGFHGDKTTRWSEEFQAYLYEESIAMFDKIDGLSGMSPWILCDFMSPLRQLHQVQDGWNRKGLISEQGKKKQAFYVLKKYYESK